MHIGVNNLPKVVTQRCLEQDLNPRPTDRKPKCLTVAPPRHQISWYISKKTCPNFTKVSIHVTCGSGSVLLLQQCNMLCTSGCVNDVIFVHNQRRKGDAMLKETHRSPAGSTRAKSWCLKLTPAVFCRQKGTDIIFCAVKLRSCSFSLVAIRTVNVLSAR